MTSARGAVRPVGLAAALLASLLLLGCGSGGSGETSSATQPAQPGGTASQPAPQGPPSKSRGDAGKAHPRYEDSEEEIENLGSEAAGSEREAVLETEQEYLKALSQSDFTTVCALLAPGTKSQLQQLVQGRHVGCATILPRLLGSPGVSTARVYLQGKLRRVRIQGDKAFVIFHAPGARLYMIGLVQEAGHWRLGSLTATVLAPSAAALEG